MQRTNRNVWLGIGIIVLLLLVASSWGGGMAMGRGLAGPFGFGARPFVAPWFFGFWGLSALIRLLFFGALIFLLVRLFRGRRYRGYYASYGDDPSYTHLPPEEILRRRYAAGELSREQYEDMRALVRSGSADPLKSFGEACRVELKSMRATV